MPATRPLTIADLPDISALSATVGWNQTPDDWRMLRQLAPDGCLGIEVDGQIAATTTLVCYGQAMAWIGMVLTHPEFRGRGLARQLVTDVLAQARTLGVKTVKLDATDQGRPLYASLGFVDEQPIERWAREGTNGSTTAAPTSAYSADAALDGEAQGYDRTEMLASLAARGSGESSDRGFLLQRSGRVCRYLGPCVGRDHEAAMQLLSNCLDSSMDTAWYWDLLPENKNAAIAAAHFGFTRQRVLTRMRLGPDVRGRDELIYAIAGFEVG